MEKPRITRASEKQIADSLSEHAADAPSDARLLAAVHAGLHRRRTSRAVRAVGAVVVLAAVVAAAIVATHAFASELRTDPQVSRPGPPGSTYLSDTAFPLIGREVTAVPRWPAIVHGGC